MSLALAEEALSLEAVFYLKRLLMACDRYGQGW